MKVVSYVWAVFLIVSAIWAALFESGRGTWLLVFSNAFSAVFFLYHAYTWTPEKSARIFGRPASKKDNSADSE